jgi:hypothetical protein
MNVRSVSLIITPSVRKCELTLPRQNSWHIPNLTIIGMRNRSTVVLWVAHGKWTWCVYALEQNGHLQCFVRMAWPTLNGNAKSYNNRYWCSKILMLFVMPLKGGGFCAVSMCKPLGPSFWRNNKFLPPYLVNSDSIIARINER